MKKSIQIKKSRLLPCLPSSSRENRWIKRAKAGHQNAFAQLYEKYVEAIYGFIFTRVEGNMVAEDLTSQVFLKAWESIGRFQEQGGSFRAWLFRIARNTIIDHYRTTKSCDCLDLLLADEPDPDGNVEAYFEVQLEEEELVEAIAQLTDEQRQAICLKFLAGLPNDEVARAMGKRTGAVRALQMRGLQTLAKILKVTESTQPG